VLTLCYNAIRYAEFMELNMTPVCTIAPTAAADSDGVEIG
jgi:hypothetical protein